MMRYLFFIFLAICCSPSLWGQENAIDQYIQQALESNIALQKQSLSYEASLAALEEAKSYYFPTLSIQARYSVAAGGRILSFPVGDLVNPVYQNLNLLNSVAQQATPDYPVIPEYPGIENVEEPFLRPTDQESVLRLQMPLFNSAILYNHRIQQNLAQSQQIGVDIYKRVLIKEVKSAYYQYAQAQEGVQILEDALSVVEENLRTTESLERNHKITIDEVYSAQAQVKSVEQQVAEARKNEQVAKAFFNFLLNRDYQAGIDIPETVAYAPPGLIKLDEARRLALLQREELQQLQYFVAARDQQINLNKGMRLPQVNLQADYGIQGTDYRIDEHSDFFLGSVVFSWNLFDRSTGAKVQQATIEKAQVLKQQQEVEQQIGLQVVQAYYELEAAHAMISTAEAEIQAARQAFRLVNKRYEQGQANLLTFANARTQLTSAQQNYSVAVLGYQIKLAEFERATASYPLGALTN
jgi:outer membrane protein